MAWYIISCYMYTSVIFSRTTVALDVTQFIASASSKFTTVGAKPSAVSKSSVVSGRQHLRQCMKDCLLTGHCLTTVFDEGLEVCSLYNNSLLTQSLSSVEKAVTLDSSKLYYKDYRKLDMSVLKATCSSSSVKPSSDTPCTKVWDGYTGADPQTQSFITNYEDAGSWMEIVLPHQVIVAEVEIWHRCRRYAMCSKLALNVDDNSPIEITRTCNGGSSQFDCTGVPAEKFTLTSPVTMTTLRITCVVDCANDGNDDAWGLREVQLWGFI